MGRKTFETVGRVLSGRVNIILSRKGAEWQSGKSIFKSKIENIKYKGDTRISKGKTKGLKIHNSQFSILNLEAKSQSFTVAELIEQNQPSAINYQPSIYLAHLSSKELVEMLEKSDCKELAVCGGASVYRQFDQADLLETLYLTIHPVKFGKGISLFGDEKFEFSDLDKKYQKVEEKKLDKQGTRLEIFRRQ
jgi:dihydrofolate reductase